MKLPLVCFVVLIRSAIADTIPNNSLSTYEMAADDGYDLLKYDIRTEDGYDLTLYRLPARGRPVVFLMHGLFGSYKDFLRLDREKALAYMLSDAGYDVWMGNARGNTFSRNMTNMTASAKNEYWDFSWHEIGYFDLAAFIDFILMTTGLKQITYVGHSQGTTAFFVLLAMRPEYNAKICTFLGLAPIAYMKNATNMLVQLSELTTVFSLTPGMEFLSHNDCMAALASMFCNGSAPTEEVCSSLLLVILGFEKSQQNETLLPLIFRDIPAGGSDKQVIHYGQLKLFDRFQQYDYGVVGNLIKYGSLSPPPYDLSKVTVSNMYLFYGAGDTFADPTDVRRLYRELPNTTVLYEVGYPKWSHMDFIWGKDANTYVYDPLIEILKVVCNESTPTSTSKLTQ